MKFYDKLSGTESDPFVVSNALFLQIGYATALERELNSHIRYMC